MIDDHQYFNIAFSLTQIGKLFPLGFITESISTHMRWDISNFRIRRFVIA